MIIYGLVPARAGSKSISRKNLLPFKGRPLFVWSVICSNLSRNISKTFVTSDDNEVLEIANKNKALSVSRPESLALDLSRDIEYIDHFFKYLENSKYETPDLIVILRPTYPKRDYKIVDRAIEEFMKISSKYDSLRSLILSDQTPFKMWFMDSENTLTPVINKSNIEEPFNAPRQLLPKVYWQDGCLEIINVNSYVKGKYPGKIKGFLNTNPSYDIDYLSDIPKDDLPGKDDLKKHLPKDFKSYSS